MLIRVSGDPRRALVRIFGVLFEVKLANGDFAMWFYTDLKLSSWRSFLLKAEPNLQPDMVLLLRV